MNKFLPKLSVASTLLATSIGMANASVLTFTDTYIPATAIFLSPTNTTFSFTQSILPQGFNVVTDTITSAALQLFFRDDQGQGDGGEKVDVFLDQNLVSAGVEANNTYTYTFASPFAYIADGLLTNGLVDVKIGGGNSQIGDFYFDRSLLTVSVERNTPEALQLIAPLAISNNVPEPSSSTLAGLALVALGVGRRGRKAGSCKN